MTFKVMRAWDKGLNKIGYVYRNEATGKSKLGETTFERWFYVKLSDFEERKGVFDSFLKKNEVLGYEVVNKYVKVFINTKHASELLNKDMEWVWEYKDYSTRKIIESLKEIGIQTYEADVKSCKRWLLQNNVSIENKYKMLLYDIETDDRHADGLTPGKYRILSIAAKMTDTDGTDGKMYWLCLEEDSDEAERKMLVKFAKLLNMNDVIVSFNGMVFDDPYVRSRFMRYGIEIDWRKKFLIDHCWVYKKYGPKLTSYSLDNISKSVLERGKVEHEGERIWGMWESNRKLLKEYNIEDVQLMYDIEKKTGFIAAHMDICVEGMSSVDCIYVSRKIDNFILKQAEEDNEYHFPTVEYSEEENTDSYTGAYVFPPQAGRYKNVKVLDFKSLYPNIIISFGISPDTLIRGNDVVDDYTTAPNGAKFRKDFIGILPKVVMKLKTKRDHFKKLMSKEIPGSPMHKVYDKIQYIYKYFGLSFYGCMGEKHNRCYDIKIAEAITLSGQHLIKASAAYLEKNNFKVVCGQTDSLFVAGIKKESHVKKICDKLDSLCEKICVNKFNCAKSTIAMDYDKGFKTFFIGGGKLRYAGVLDYLDGHEIKDFNMYIAGYEYKRTDTCGLVKKKQYELLKRILENEEQESTERIVDFIVDLKRDVLAGKVAIEDITFSQRITKELDEYEGRQMHVNVAREMMKDNKEFYVGDKVQFFILGLDSEKKPIAKPIYKFKGDYCESYYWNNKIFPPLQRILQVGYPKIDWKSYLIKGNGEVKTGRTDLW